MKNAAATKKRVMTPKQWAEAEALWESGEVRYEDLVAKFGSSVSTFERHFKKKGVVKGAKAAATKKRVEEQLAKAAVDEATVTAVRIKETKEQHYTMAQGLARLAWNEILEARQSKAPYATRLNNLKAIDAAMAVIKKAREERYSVLGLDRPDAVDPDELPELVIAELTEEQIKELRDRDHTELDDLPPAAAGESATPAGDDEDEDDGAVVEEA
ncbi:hypothetical protein [Herbaspirillum huttiense]|uniref:DNA-binding protein n=1 Tax=Herbaspirillum huttiense subsp. lycopersici TaxID=3074428 RepID=A0ABU2EFW8_9BURK|nr:hypothetical protein [Herbaspirillum huttiense]MDR9847029.1 hypothetical protein [Herbaspirillum huttiense SE1]